MFHFCLLLLTIVVHLADSQNAGHLKPFGSVGSLIDVEDINGAYPTLSKLFTDYIPKSKPVVSRHVLNQSIDDSLWQSDEHLQSEVYGLSKAPIHIEGFKGRQRERIPMTFGEFLDRYTKEHLMFADNVPEILRKYLIVPRPLQCDGVLETFQSAIMIINSISASPLLFGDRFDHFHCILRGQKHFVLVDTNKYPNARQLVVPDQRQTRGPPFNPDRVDLDQFPTLVNVEYHIAKLTSADCLFIPSNWIFQERSLENTIAVIYNINHQQAVDIDASDIEKCAKNETYDAKFTLDQVDWTAESEPQNLKELMMNLIKKKVQGHDKWRQTFSKHLTYDLAADPELSAIFEEFYGIVDVDGDGQVTATEIEQINGAHQHHISDVIYEMARVIHGKRKDGSAKATGAKPEEPVDYDDQEALSESPDDHSDYDRTDL